MLRTLLVLSVLLLSTTAQASTIVGPQVTDSGKLVELSGLEWLTLTEADAGQLDVNQMLAAFDDSTSDFFGWRYASRLETEALFDSLWGGVSEDLDASNYDGASWFFDTFGVGPQFSTNGGYGADGTGLWSMAFGPDGCGTAITACLGSLRVKRVEFGSVANVGRFTDAGGLSVGLDDQNVGVAILRDNSVFSNPEANYSHLLVRNAVVPVPGALWLMLSALGAIIWIRREAR